MGVPQPTPQDGDTERLTRPRRATPDNSSTTPLVTSAVGDRCSNCGAPLVADQRYCVNCGERRGRARFPFQAATAAPATTAAPPAPWRPSSGATLVAGIATLLLAMGVGVLIGHDSNSGNVRQAAATPQVVTVNGGGGAAGATTGGGAALHGGKHAKTAAVKPTKVVVTKKVAAAANAAAGKVLGSNANLAPPTTQVGGGCTHGAGCQGGHFTGNFFGGG